MAGTGQRFYALDGMRGICALLVLLFHLYVFAHYNHAVYGYLSVDAFFVISGFVIALVFGDKLADGMGCARFLIARARRLGPVHLAGTFLCGLAALTHYNFQTVAGAALFNFLLIPLPVGAHEFAFPLNVPTWSLFVEFWVNVGFAFVATRLSRRTLLSIMAIGWISSGYVAYDLGTANFGPVGGYVYLAGLRGAAAFSCGVLIFDLLRSGALSRVPSLNPLIVFAGFIAIAILPFPSWHGIHDIVATTLLAPVAILLLVRSNGAVPSVIMWLGRVSYPLYATHFSIVTLTRNLNLGHSFLEQAAALAISLALADAIARWYEPLAIRAVQSFPNLMPRPASLIEPR